MTGERAHARFQPIDAAAVPRFAGMPTFMRLPVATPGEVDIALAGVPPLAGRPPRPTRDPTSRA